MRKFIIYILMTSAVLQSCGKSELGITSGNVVDEIFVSADAGSLSVSVETTGRWLVYEADNADWIKFDVKGGLGKGAFTMSWQSNMSNIVDMKESRKAKVVITSEDHAKSDTLNLVQQGFNSIHQPTQTQEYKDIVLEFEEVQSKTVKVVYCSAEGVEDMKALSEWAGQYDVVACGSSFLKPALTSDSDVVVYDAYDGICLVSADFSEIYDADSTRIEFERFRELIDVTYNAENSCAKWIIGGQFYHLSMMQTAYDETPQWYPEDVGHEMFASDLYAWNNNLYDCLWMKERRFVSTWTSADDSRSYMADYVYVSRDVLATICSVRMLEPVLGMRHNPIEITLMY